MPLLNHVRFTTQKSDAESERRVMEEGSTINDVLTDELCVNPDKFAVYVNGVEISDLNQAVRENDKIRIEPKKYSSGRD